MDNFIYKSKFCTKCHFCEMKFKYMTNFKNQNRFCSICGKSFIIEEYQDNSEIQSRILKGELWHYKASNKKLQFEIEKEKYFNRLIEKDNRYFKERIRDLIAQNEELKTKRKKNGPRLTRTRWRNITIKKS